MGVMKERTENMEINISCCGEKAFIDSNLPMWKNRITSWAEKYPESVQILKAPELNDGYIYASIPAGWLKKIKPNKEYTQEERDALAQRLRRSAEGATE